MIHHRFRFQKVLHQMHPNACNYQFLFCILTSACTHRINKSNNVTKPNVVLTWSFPKVLNKHSSLAELQEICRSCESQIQVTEIHQGRSHQKTSSCIHSDGPKFFWGIFSDQVLQVAAFVWWFLDCPAQQRPTSLFVENWTVAGK